MDNSKKISVLDITYYMECPPITGGALRVLSPLLKMGIDSGITVDILFSTWEQDYADKCKKYLEDVPVIGYAEGVVTRHHESISEGCPTDFSDNVWRTMSRELKIRAVELVSKKHYDVIQIEHSQMAWIVPFLRLASPKSYFVLDCHNVEYKIYETWVSYATKSDEKMVQIKYETLRKWEESVWPWFDAAFAVSPIEEELLHKNGISETYLVPTGGGIDPDKYKPENDERNRPYDLLYIGTMNWYPNAHGLLWFIDKVFPLVLSKRPETVLHIVGQGNPDGDLVKVANNNKNIKFWGKQQDDVKFFHNSKVFIVPLWIGAGARVKVITAWAAKIPVVSTVFGPEGSDATNGKNIYVTDDPEEYAECVLRLLDDPKECERIYENAYETFIEKYTIQKCVDILVKSYHIMTNNAKGK